MPVRCRSHTARIQEISCWKPPKSASLNFSGRTSSESLQCYMHVLGTTSLAALVYCSRRSCSTCVLIVIAACVVLFLQAEHFITNFSEDRGFSALTRQRWTKWIDRHQELPLSLARIGYASFHVGKGLRGGGNCRTGRGGRRRPRFSACCVAADACSAAPLRDGERVPRAAPQMPRGYRR